MKFAIAFPGQGSQYIGMCQKLIEEYPVAAEIFEEANDVLNFDIRSLILNGHIEELTLSENAQPAVVTASVALYRVLQEETGVIPFYGVGHSLGEISALIAAEALTFGDGVSYARKRGKIMHRAMEEQKGRAGIVVDLDIETLSSIIEDIRQNDYVTISGYNSPKQFIVAGIKTALSALEKEVDQTSGDFIPFRMMPMKADAPYHSALMEYLKPEIEEALENIVFSQPKFAILSTVTGKVVGPNDSISEILKNQLVSPVLWNEALHKMHESGVECWIDIGPDKIIRNLIRENRALPASLAFEDEEDRQKIYQYMKKEVFK